MEKRREYQKFLYGDKVRWHTVEGYITGSYADMCRPHHHGEMRNHQQYGLLWQKKDGSIHSRAWVHEPDLEMLAPRTLESIGDLEMLQDDGDRQV